MNIKSITYYLKTLIGISRDGIFEFHLVTKLARKIIPSYKFTWPELAWFKNEKLARVLKHFGEIEGFNAHRRFALQQLIRLTSKIPGDTAECGVYKGCGSYIILQANMRSPFCRVHHIFDSFEGLSKPLAKDGNYWNENDLSVGENVVNENLAEFGSYKFYKGWIPDRFQDTNSNTFSFVHVDVDLYQPTKDSISFFYNKLNAGGIFVCDDYGFLTCPGATTAIDEFLINKPEKMVSLAGGGGFFIKGCETTLE